MINYNRDLFDVAGMAYPKSGWTWDEFREVAKKLTVKDSAGNVTQWGYEVPNQNFFIQPWFFSNGTSILNDDWSASNMTDPKVAESLQFLHDLIHVDGVSPIPGGEYLDNQFLAGQIAMISRGHWIIPNVRNAKLNMDVAIPPSKVNRRYRGRLRRLSASPRAQRTWMPWRRMVAELTGPELEADVAKSAEAPCRAPGTRLNRPPHSLHFHPRRRLYYQHRCRTPSPYRRRPISRRSS